MPPNANKEIYDLPAPNQRIRAKMQAKHISQQDLCDWLHMSSSSISRLLQGESTLTFDVAVVISQHLGMSLDEIAGHSSSNDQHNIDAVINLYENRLTAVRATHSRLVSAVPLKRTRSPSMPERVTVVFPMSMTTIMDFSP